jgi:mono/diheme cytochrome c family protein
MPENATMIRVGIYLLLLLAAIGAEAQNGMRHGRRMMHNASMARHHYVMRHGLEAPYAGKTMPRPPTAADLANGRALFALHCASCHGERGAGDGEAGAGLNPPPANVAFAARLPMATDAYLFWTIAEGGAPVGSAMPPFKGVLADAEVWQVVAYLRDL